MAGRLLWTWGRIFGTKLGSRFLTWPRAFSRLASNVYPWDRKK